MDLSVIGKKCGVPHHDGNANVESEARVTGTTLIYECLDGFKAGTDDEYEILCENSGAWEGVELRCAGKHDERPMDSSFKKLIYMRK